MKDKAIATFASAIIFLGACGSNTAKAETLQLEFDTTTKTQPATPPPVPGKKQESTTKTNVEPSEKTLNGLKVRLNNQSFSIAADADHTEIYDFGKKLVLRLNNKEKSFDQNSLYSIAGFKEPEIHNRAMLREVLKKTGVKENPFDPYDVSCELGLPFPDQPENPGIKVTADGNKVTYAHNGKVVVEADLGDDVPSAYQPILEKYYIYNSNLHPFIRKDLLGRKKFLKHLHYDVNSMRAQVTVDQTLMSNAIAPEETIEVPSGFHRSFDSKSPLFSLQQKILTSGTAPALPTMDATFKAAKECLQNKQNVDAVFTMFEHNLMTGETDNEKNKEIFSVAMNDPEVTTIWRAIEQPTSEEDAKTKLSDLEKIDTKKYAKGYLIEIFKGNIITTLQKGSPPTNFLAALKSNPLIVGVYKDLGTFYYSRFESGDAWDCFELARAIKPTHPMLKEVTEIEKGLEKRAPDLFL